MCGIVGLVGWENHYDKSFELIKKMRLSLDHRGPDSNGIWSSSSKHVYFGHSRLSIIDLTNAGSQPMISSCGRYVLTFNGEIYNHDKIRKQLEKLFGKISWRGSSDSETLVETIAKLGLDKTLDVIEGMYAFGLFDQKLQALSLVRDRFGEKPLYFTQIKKGSVAFSSEIKSLKHIPEFDPSLNLDAVACFFQRGYVGGQLSVWNNVEKVLPGTVLHFNSKNGKDFEKSCERIYWSLEDLAVRGKQNNFLGSYDEAKNKLEQKLMDSVVAQTRSDVPLGVFLSGGIDSTLVTTLLQNSLSNQIKTFSIGFSEKGYDESIYAEKIADFLKTDHTTLMATPNDAINLIELMPSVYCEPFADSSQIPTTLLCQLVRKHVSVALTGDGGDEVFSGYLRYLFANRTYKYLTYGPEFGRQLLSNMIGKISPKALDYLGVVFGVKRLADKAIKAANVMQTNSIEEYYDNLITYWPQGSIVKHNNPLINKFDHRLEDIENMMLVDQLN
jgi:asparagine synthase (glutamine-hydrolysing)